jgi:hypothetical protein
MPRLLSPLVVFSLTLLGWAVFASLGACAQSGDGRYVRVTTGATQFRDWERPLIQGNPNLSHFTWVPVTGYQQGRQKVIQRRGPDSQIVQNSPGSRQRSVYVKPIQVPANYIANRPANPDVHGAIRVPTVIGKRTTPADEAIHGAIRVPPGGEGDLLGKLARQQAAAAVAARLKTPVVASYPAVTGSLYPHDSESLYGQGSSKSVRGLLRAAFRDH